MAEQKEVSSNGDKNLLQEKIAKLKKNVLYQQCLENVIEEYSDMRRDIKSAKLLGKKAAAVLKLKFQSAEAFEDTDRSYRSVKNFGAPYFKDMKKFSPGKNSDQVKMEQLGFLDVANLEAPKKWQHWEMKLLEVTLRKVALGALRRPLVAKRSILLDQQKVERKANLSSALTDVRIAEINEQIQQMSGEALFDKLSDQEAEHDWCRISVTEFEGQRSPLELRAMWKQCLVLTLERTAWTKHENDLLRFAASKYCFQNWAAIGAEEMSGKRSMYQCFLHYQSILNKFREGWSGADDKKLKSAVKNLQKGKFIPWQKIADRFPGKSVKQVAQRWTQRLDPKIKSGGFTERDDMIITAARSQKMTFMQISNLMPGRTESQIRIRYTRLECFKPSVPWIPEDDQKLLALVKQFKGSRDQWSIVNEYFPDRDRQQLKGRHKRLLNDAAGIKTTLPRKGKRSIWVLNKRRTTPIFNARNVVKFACNAQKARKVGRRRKKKDDLDLELDQVYRSHYRQRRGRKRKYYPNTAKPATVNVARNLCEIFGVHFDWNCEQRLLKAAATNPKFYNILNVYRQLRMLHYEEGWDCEKKHVTQSIPPNFRSLVGLRTLLLEERNILAMSLEDQNEVPTYLKGVVTRADLTCNAPEEDFNDVDENDEDAHRPEQNDESSYELPRMNPEEALSLFMQRFCSLLLWPSYMSRIAPLLDYKKDLFEGERMACASSNEDDDEVDKLFSDFDTDEEDKVKESLNEMESEEERKRMLRKQWLQYREEKLSQPLLEEKELPEVLRKKRRLPKKRGRKKMEADNWLQSHIRNNIDFSPCNFFKRSCVAMEERGNSGLGKGVPWLLGWQNM
ncbi:uncharacterized protein LOC132195654 [Neocloeon triangulifer]|uniref:uncharacterized protein LOC132195654 n=1 Tax=Neocloeon triangulifer TaxID=2078957 RepID=UPI00286EF349|nr:uncharacterized protein LOC132195654 [Neocloeon triangulifer]